MEQLTPRQQQILDLIKIHLEEHGVPPTRVELAEELGFRSPNAAEDHLRALARKGAIELIPGASRGIRVVEEEQEGLPLVGKVAAGSPILAMENVADRYPVPAEMFHPPADYLLKVKGMSMKDAGIMEDDLLVVHKTNRARKGQIVVARLHDEVTVKRYEKDGRMVYLYPENEDFDVIAVDLNSEPFEIEGLAVGVIRDRL